MKINNTFAIGCLVQWYEIEMISEYIESLKQSLNQIKNKENVIVDFTITTNQSLEKISDDISMVDIEKRFIKSGVLDKFDWDSGPNVWHIDTINKHNGKLKDIYKWTANYFDKKYGPTLAVNWLRLSKSGDKILRRNKMIVEKGLKKFR